MQCVTFTHEFYSHLNFFFIDASISVYTDGQFLGNFSLAAFQLVANAACLDGIPMLISRIWDWPLLLPKTNVSFE